jgi:2'-5' RNA ligase
VPDDLGPPSERSAVIVRARLPSGLERIRRRSVGDAVEGVPAHLTLLYPFVEPAVLTPDVRGALREVARRHPPFEYELGGIATWPDTIYVGVQSTAPFVRLQRELQLGFPAFPIYGRDSSFRFVPHVTIPEGRSIQDPRWREPGAWAALPRPARAEAIEVIAQGLDGRWRVAWRIPLGCAVRGSAADRMRP